MLYGCLNSRCQIKLNLIAYPVVIYNQLSAIIKIDCLFIIVTYDYNRGKFGRSDVGGDYQTDDILHGQDNQERFCSSVSI